MASIVLNGDTSGSVTVSPPAVAGTQTITLPAASGQLMVSGNMPAFSAYQSSAQTLSSATFTKILFQSEEWDTNNNFASSTFTPTVAGYYSLSCAVAAGTSATRIILDIYKNGSVYKRFYDSSSGGALFNISGTTQVYCNGTTDYIEIYAYFATGQACNTTYHTWFNGSLVRAA